MKRFTIEEIKKYITSQDSLGDVLYNLSERNIDKANEKKPVIGYRVNEDCQLDGHNFEAEELIIIDEHWEDRDWQGTEWYESYPEIFEPIFELEKLF